MTHHFLVVHPWYIDEFGCVLPLVAIVFAIYFWSKRRELPAS
jgi:CAAX protease family protein